jgi:RNA polymerase sigma-70 factor (ECF subfamily)
MANFDQLFRKYHHQLFLYALKFVADDLVALDITQDVFAQVWEKDKLNLPDEHLKAYLFHAVRNHCLNHLKRQKIILKHQQYQQAEWSKLEIDYYESGEKSLIQKENLERIYETVNSLSEVNREIIQLSRFEGLKNKEIAERLGIPIRTVETRIFRALKELRQKLSQKFIRILLIFCSLKE